MSADESHLGQKHRNINPNSLMNLRPPWEPGKSPNPGGLPKGTPKVSVAYAKLLALSAEDLETFKPATVAESIALARVREAQSEKRRGLANTAEITDRTEGKAKQTLELNNSLEHERIIIRLQERFLARTGVELPREEAIARLAEIDPAIAAQFGDSS